MAVTPRPALAGGDPDDWFLSRQPLEPTEAVWYACRENENGERRGTRDVVVDVRAASNGGVPSAPPGRFLSYLSRNRKPGPLLPPKVIQSARCVCVCA